MKRQHRNNRFKLCITAWVLLTGTLSFSAFKDPGSIGPIDWSVPPAGWTQVYIINSTTNKISCDFSSYPIPIGDTSHILGFSSNMPTVNNPLTFNISRNSHNLLSVTFQVIRFPEVDPNEKGYDWQSAYIDITENSTGVLDASVPDSSSSWIKILSVNH